MPGERSDRIRIDADLLNADWLKSRTWDVRRRDWEPAQTVADLREVGMSDEEILALLTLPAGRAMPRALRVEIEAMR